MAEEQPAAGVDAEHQAIAERKAGSTEPAQPTAGPGAQHQADARPQIAADQQNPAPEAEPKVEPPASASPQEPPGGAQPQPQHQPGQVSMLPGGLGATGSLHMLPTNPMLFQQLQAMQMHPISQQQGGQGGAGQSAPTATGGSAAGAAQAAAGQPEAEAAGRDAAVAPDAGPGDDTGGATAAAAAAAGGALVVMPSQSVAVSQDQSPMLAQNDQSFVCNICRKSFKREMNLIFHMTTHRQRQTVEGVGEIQNANAPVKCSDCPKVFATKYQAKKHFLRRHFKGDRPYKCLKCKKKSFTVKEDLTMHMKACGQVFTCSCGIRLCSLGALKRHAKYFKHEPTNWEGTPVHGDYGLLRGPGGIDDVAGALMVAHDGSAKVPVGPGEDEEVDSDEEGALGANATSKEPHRSMPVDMADGAAAHALLMADQSRVAAHFDHGTGGPPAMPPPLPQLWVQPQGGVQVGPDLMRQQMQLQHHLLNQAQLHQAILAHPHLQIAQYPAALQVRQRRARVRARNSVRCADASHAPPSTLAIPAAAAQQAMQSGGLSYMAPGVSMAAAQHGAYGRLGVTAAQTAAANAAVDVVAAAPSMTCSIPEPSHQGLPDANGMFAGGSDYNSSLALAAAAGAQQQQE